MSLLEVIDRQLERLKSLLEENYIEVGVYLEQVQPLNEMLAAMSRGSAITTEDAIQTG